MHARQLVELAAWIANHGSAVIRLPGQLSASGVQQFWTASRCRLDRWGRAFKELSSSDVPQPPLAARELRSLAEEVLASEILTRVWSAVLTVYDRRRNSRELEPVAQNALRGQLDARQRVLQLIARSPNLDLESAVQLNRLRRRCERWNDLLLSHLLLEDDVVAFAVDPERSRDFADEFRERRRTGKTDVWPIILGSLRAAFDTFLLPHSPNADLNEQIAGGILASFPGECFDTFGLLPSLWLVRMSHAANDAQGMIDEMLAIDSAAGGKPTRGNATGNASRRFDGRSDPSPFSRDE